MTVTVEELADLIGDLGLVCELLPCRGEDHPAIWMIHIHHHCPAHAKLRQVWAADHHCVEEMGRKAPLCAFCHQVVEIAEIVPL